MTHIKGITMSAEDWEREAQIAKVMALLVRRGHVAAIDVANLLSLSTEDAQFLLDEMVEKHFLKISYRAGLELAPKDHTRFATPEELHERARKAKAALESPARTDPEAPWPKLTLAREPGGAPELSAPTKVSSVGYWEYCEYVPVTERALTGDEATGLADCIELVAFMLMPSMEVVGGVEVSKAVRNGRKALEKLDIDFEQVEEP